jgi:hypothetical protein
MKLVGIAAGLVGAIVIGGWLTRRWWQWKQPQTIAIDRKRYAEMLDDERH